MFITINGARLFFDVVGPALEPTDAGMQEKPTLLMLHGGPGYDHSTLRPHFDRFADAYQVIYIDHRGCGRSPADHASCTLDQWADDIASFCATLGIEKPMVFGQSFGGMVAMHYAARYPDGPHKLILSSTAAQFNLEATVEMARKLGGAEAARVAQSFFSAPSIAGYEEYGRVCLPLYTQGAAMEGAGFRNRAVQRPEITVHFFQNEMMEMDMRPEIASITCPTLVLAGALDPVTPLVCSEEIAAAIGDNARLEVFGNCGHGVHRDDPDGSEEVMRSFLAQD